MTTITIDDINCAINQINQEIERDQQHIYNVIKKELQRDMLLRIVQAHNRRRMREEWFKESTKKQLTSMEEY
jgi:hemerythrin-like domain-containing protein